MALAILGVVSAVVLASSRETSHLAVWTVRESTSPAEFATAPAAPIAVLSESPGNARTRGAIPSTTRARDDLTRALIVARHIVSLCAHPTKRMPVRWASTAGMLAQIRGGATADCWPRSILFASDAARAGLATRLWALEGDHFDGRPHTVPEVYLRDLGRWVMLDVTLNAYVRDRSGAALGLLELRGRVLEGGADSLAVLPIEPGAPPERNAFLRFYADRSRCAFLRRSDALDSPRRFGALAPLSGELDRLPDGAKKLASAVLGGTGTVLYLHDAHNTSLRRAAWAARAWLWIGVLSVAGTIGFTGLRVLVALAYALYSRPPAGVWSFEESFESDDLSAFRRLGTRQMCRADSARVVVHGGRHALRVRLDPTDPLVRGGRRAEMRFPATRLHTCNDYAFRILLPADGNDGPLELAVAQWHSVPDRWLTEQPVPSPLLLSIAGGRWRLWSCWDARRVIRSVAGTEEPRDRALLLDQPVEWDRWAEWAFHVRWAWDESGLLSVTKDGVEVVHRAGPNCYNDAIGPYFKFGLYWLVPAPIVPAARRIAYFEGIRLSQGHRT